MTSENSPPPYDFNSLTILQGHEQDNSIVSVNPQTLSALNGITVGTPVLVQASAEGIRGFLGETVCTINIDAGVEPGRIKVNPCVKYSLGVAWGEQVRVDRCPNIGFGQSITVSPVQDSLKYIEGDLQTEFLQPYFDVGYRPIHVGDLFLVKDREGSKAVECKVKSCDPSPFCFVTPNTQVICADAEPREVGDNMLHEFHEWKVGEEARRRQAAAAENCNTERRYVTVTIPANQLGGRSGGIRPGDIVSVVPGADGQPRLQRVPRGQIPVTVTRTVVVNNDNQAAVNNVRATYLCVRLCICVVVVVVAIVGGLAAGFSS